MTRNEVIMRAIAGKLTWIQAADICGITARQMRQMRRMGAFARGAGL